LPSRGESHSRLILFLFPPFGGLLFLGSKKSEGYNGLLLKDHPVIPLENVFKE
jgi:hypothetical protein